MSTGETWRLGHRPALDGLRGVAVLMVLAGHAGITTQWTDATHVAGVSVFFTLSGFLITALLLDEISATGRLNLGRFYLRRGARLFPAMVACVALAVVVEVIFLREITDPNVIVGTLTYTSNFVMIDSAFDQRTALGHTWSLAIEEQFYLLWPLLLLALVKLPRRWFLLAICYGLAGSLLIQTVIGPGWRGYFGPDIRAQELLIGGLLAATLHGQPARRVPPIWMWAGFALLAGWALAPMDQETLFLVLPKMAALGTAGVILHASQRRAPFLERRWLRWAGLVSYGLYLYHPPLMMAAEEAGLPAWIGVAAAVPVAAVSYRWLETPIRKRLRDRAVIDGPHVGGAVGVGDESPARGVRLGVMQAQGDGARADVA